MMPKIYIRGMHGIGDCLHQRAVVAHYIKTHDVYLETSWPQLYWDMPVTFVGKGTDLRTQLKNQERSKDFYIQPTDVPMHIDTVKVGYGPASVRAANFSVLLAMLKTSRVPAFPADFSFTARAIWEEEARYLLGDIQKPLLIYRPLIVRKEWEAACRARNPDAWTYTHLFKEIRDNYHVVSIADTVPGVEDIISEDIGADQVFHKGELSIEIIAGLTQLASLVYCSPGFMTVMARAMSVPVITVFGGYESSKSFSVGRGPFLGIDTVKPCSCFQHEHECVKTIDIPAAKAAISQFITKGA